MLKELIDNQRSQYVIINKEVNYDREFIPLIKDKIIQIIEEKVQLWCIHHLQTILKNNFIQKY